MEISPVRRRQIVENGLIAVFSILLAGLILIPGEISTFRIVCGSLLLVLAAYRAFVALRAARN